MVPSHCSHLAAAPKKSSNEFSRQTLLQMLATEAHVSTKFGHKTLHASSCQNQQIVHRFFPYEVATEITVISLQITLLAPFFVCGLFSAVCSAVFFSLWFGRFALGTVLTIA